MWLRSQLRLRSLVRLRRRLLLALQEALLHLRPHQGPLGCQARLLRPRLRLRSQLRLRSLVRLRSCPELRLQLSSIDAIIRRLERSSVSLREIDGPLRCRQGAVFLFRW